MSQPNSVNAKKLADVAERAVGREGVVRIERDRQGAVVDGLAG